MAQLGDLLNTDKSKKAFDKAKKQKLIARPVRRRSYLTDDDSEDSPRESLEEDVVELPVVEEVVASRVKKVEKKNKEKVAKEELVKPVFKLNFNNQKDGKDEVKPRSIEKKSKVKSPAKKKEAPNPVESLSYSTVNSNYTRVHNMVLESLYQYDFNVSQLRMILYILRQTLGWNRSCALIKKDDFEFHANMSNNRIYDTRKKLVESGVIKFVTIGKDNYYYLIKSFFNIKDEDFKVSKTSTTANEKQKSLRKEVIFQAIMEGATNGITEKSKQELSEKEYSWIVDNGGAKSLNNLGEYSLRKKLDVLQ